MILPSRDSLPRTVHRSCFFPFVAFEHTRTRNPVPRRQSWSNLRKVSSEMPARHLHRLGFVSFLPTLTFGHIGSRLKYSRPEAKAQMSISDQTPFAHKVSFTPNRRFHPARLLLWCEMSASLMQEAAVDMQLLCSHSNHCCANPSGWCRVQHTYHLGVRWGWGVGGFMCDI